MKKAIIGLVAGMLIGSAGMAAAATTQTVQVAIAKFTFSVDGQEQTLKNDPLVYKGTTYLPVREVAEMTGYGLEYDNTKKSIDLQSKGGTPVSSVNPVINQPENEIDLSVWTPAKEVVQKHSVAFTIGKEKTTVALGDVTLTFPLTTTSGVDSDGATVLYQNEGKTASLLVYSSSIYFGKDTLALLGITSQ